MTFRDFLDRYGVVLAIATAITLVLVLLPGNARREDTVQTGFGGPGDQAADLGRFDDGGSDVPGEVVDGAVSGGTPGAGAGSGAGQQVTGRTGRAGSSSSGGSGAVGQVASGGAGGIVFGQGACRGDQRMLGISRYMPPCLTFSGDNGGSTGRGVTRDKIKVVRWIQDRDAATQAILEGAKLADPPPVVERAYVALQKFTNQHFFTYGREIVFENFKATGPSDNDEAMKADALKIAEQVKPFAVIEGDPAAGIPKVLGQELAQRGVICLCLTSLTSQFYTENPPYIFSSLPTLDDYALHIGEYVGKRLKGRPAKWAGDEFNPAQGLRTKTRAFGLVLLEGGGGRVDPEARRAKELLKREFARYGVTLAAEVGYTYDPGRNQQDVTNLIASMKGAGVTTVILIVDPLYPILITQEATRQQYFPEWLITGTGLSDTTAAARLYDQSQWRHAYGISPLWVTWADVKNSEGYREYHHMQAGSPGDEGVLVNIYRAVWQTLGIGVHMAGPKLNSDTFAQGMYNYPKTGGTAGAPLAFWTRERPTAIKDFVEIFYAADERGKDERGEDGVGMVMKVEGGKRYVAGQWPASEPKAFDKTGALAVSDNPPGGGPWPHEQDGHKHTGKCLSCG